MSSATITLLFLLFAIVMFVWEKIPLGLTSMIVCVGLVVTGVLDWKVAFSGFIDSNVILFVSMFIVGGALFETGMANRIGGIVTHFAKSERQLIVAIMVIVGVMSGFLSNTGTAAILIPVVIGIAAKSGYSRSRLLMPLVFAAAMGGNLFLNAIFHAGPIIRPLENDKFEMVSVGPTTSMRMEKFEYEFVKETGVKVIIGKGGMKENTERACKEFGAIHCVFPAGNAVVAATEVEEIVRAEWRDLGMPETLWNCRVKEFGPLIVSIDTEGNNMFEKNKVTFNERKDAVYEKISKQVGFIK